MTITSRTKSLRFTTLDAHSELLITWLRSFGLPPTSVASSEGLARPSGLRKMPILTILADLIGGDWVMQDLRPLVVHGLLALVMLSATAPVVGQNFECLEPQGDGTTYYVSGRGDDENSGLSKRDAFRSLQHASDMTAPGDTVLIMNGTYTEPGEGSTVLFIEKSGTPRNWICYKAFRGHRPKIKVGSHWGGITVDGASYILIEGLTIEGNVRNVPIEYALAEKDNLSNPITSGNGISLTNSYLDESVFPHHVIIRNNHVHHCPGAGIATKHADYVRIEYNRVHHNTFTSPYAESGISMYLNSNFDDRRAFKMIVKGNVCYRNENFVPHFYSASDPDERSITDGNGISIDDSKNVQSDIPKEPYTGYTLVTGNTVYANGGRGILVYLSDNVLAVLNSSLRNARSPTMTADVEVNESSNIWVLWNWICPRRDREATAKYDNENSWIQSR